MKTLVISAFVICFATAAPTALWAAADHHEQGQAGGHAAQGKTQGGGGHSNQVQGGGGHTGQTGGSPMVGTQGRTHQHVTTQNQGGGTSGATGTQSTGTSRHRHTTTGGATGNTERTTTRTRTKVDVSSYHKNVTAERKYHFGDYRAPQGYSYHRWSYGDRLPQEYFVRDFWIINFLNFGLMTPPDGYVWVRYGPDAVLIDEDTGEIVQVVYDVFY